MGNFQEASDLESTVSISSRRFEESPFIERTECPGMIRGVYAGRYFPISLGEDHIEKYWCPSIMGQHLTEVIPGTSGPEGLLTK